MSTAMSNTWVKTLKTLNFISGKADTDAEIRRHRKRAELASRLATPKGETDRRRFRIGTIRCEEVKPVDSFKDDYVILYCHGGGYISGGLDYAGILAVKLAMATGFKVYSFAYRLAPEHPYPAAAEDVNAVWDYLTENIAEADHVLLAGDSAGGNMALCLTQRLLKEGKPAPRELLLFSPWTDMTGTAESYETNKDIDPILTKEFVMNSVRAYIGDKDPADAAFSPLFGSKNLSHGPARKKAFRLGGLKLPYNQLQFFEIHLPTSQILPRAKELKVSLTSYLGALWMLAIRDEMPPRKRDLPVTISLPVNLRNYYPSKTARNFFNSVNVTHVFDSEITLEELAAEFDAKFKSQLTEENIKKQMDNFETMEYVAPVRVVPLFIKQLVVRHFTKKSNKKVTMTFSNMGVQKPPRQLGERIENYSGFCSTNTIFSTMFGYGDNLTLGVSSAYMNTGVVKNFVRSLSASGVEISICATEVIR